MFDDLICVEVGPGQLLRFHAAEAVWEGRSQTCRESTDLYWLRDERWLLRRRPVGAAPAAPEPHRIVSVEEARAWLKVRPCAPLRAACLGAYQSLDFLQDLKHELTEKVEREVRRLWRLMREMVGQGVAPSHPDEPTFIPDLRAGRAAVGEALRWCQALEESVCGECRHGPGFRSVVWYCTPYTFSAGQAACVEVLWRAWGRGTPDVSQSLVMEQADSARETPRLSDLFSKHPAWGVMIVPTPGSKGAYRLAPPD